MAIFNIDLSVQQEANMSEMDAIIAAVNNDNENNDEMAKKESSEMDASLVPANDNVENSDEMGGDKMELSNEQEPKSSEYEKTKGPNYQQSPSEPVHYTEAEKSSPETEYPKTRSEYISPSTESSYHKEVETSSPEYVKPTSEDRSTSKPTYYGQEDQHGEIEETNDSSYNEEEAHIMSKIDELQGKLENLQDEIENYLKENEEETDEWMKEQF